MYQCDRGQPCGRCKARHNNHCVYEIPIRQSKAQLRRDLASLRAQQHTYHLVLAGLNQPGVQAQILARLQAQQPVEGIASWLESTKQMQDDIEATVIAENARMGVAQPLPPNMSESHIGPQVKEVTGLTASALNRAEFPGHTGKPIGVQACASKL